VTTLSLNGNKLRRIDDSIGQIPSLTKLDLSNNELTELSPKIGNLTDLEGMFLVDLLSFSRSRIKLERKSVHTLTD
jgi:Leucine-rich repeat (LRR) protein